MKFKTIAKFLMVRAFEVLIAVLLITFMPNVPPDAKFTEPYSVKSPMPLEGKLALNNRLNGAEIWHKGDMNGPEAFAEYDNELYTSIHGGDIVKLTGDHIVPVVKFGKPCKGLYQEHICGRPLGFVFDKNGALYAADAYYGIYKVDVKTGKKLQLVSMDQEIDGKKPKLPNSIALSSNGDLYWTDSSTEFSLRDGLFDMFADGSGRLIHYDAKLKKNTVLIDKLHFANGVALSSDESFILISETVRNRIRRYYLKGSKKGTSDIFIDGLPGMPDNLHSYGKQGFLIPLVVPMDSTHPIGFQIFGPFPLIRKFIARFMGIIELGFKVADQIYASEWFERGVHFVGHFQSLSFVIPSGRVTVLHVSEDGELLDSFHATNKKIASISEAFVFKDHLYLGSPFNDYIARIPLAEIGLTHLKSTVQQRSIPSTTEVPRTTTKAPPTTTTSPPTTTTAPPPTTTKPPPTTTTAPPRSTTSRAAPTTTTPAPSTTTRSSTESTKPAPSTPTPTKPPTATPTPQKTATTTKQTPTTTPTPPRATTASSSTTKETKESSQEKLKQTPPPPAAAKKQ